MQGPGTGRDSVHTQRDPQLSERFDVRVGTIQLCTAREMRGAGSFLHLQLCLLQAGSRLRNEPSAIRQNDAGPGKPPNHHLIQGEKASLLLMKEVTF